MWGKFDAIVESSTGHGELKRRKRSSSQCNQVGLPRGIYRLGPIPSFLVLLHRNYMAQPREPAPMVEPPVVYDYPGFENERQGIPNTFEFNGRFTYRLLRNPSDENASGSRRPPGSDEGNGLQGIFPRAPNSTNTIYQHVLGDSYNSRFISTTVDFGRTRYLAIAAAFAGFPEESRQNHGRSYSRWFVQIDVQNLRFYDLTRSDILSGWGRSPSGILDLTIVRYARMWSEILIEGSVPSANVVAAYEVYAVNTTHYVLNVHQNSNYRS